MGGLDCVCVSELSFDAVSVHFCDAVLFQVGMDAFENRFKLLRIGDPALAFESLYCLGKEAVLAKGFKFAVEQGLPRAFQQVLRNLSGRGEFFLHIS